MLPSNDAEEKRLDDCGVETEEVGSVALAPLKHCRDT
jgi:hypothetical protein